jgi:hypothetical protein
MVPSQDGIAGNQKAFAVLSWAIVLLVMNNLGKKVENQQAVSYELWAARILLMKVLQ